MYDKLRNHTKTKTNIRNYEKLSRAMHVVIKLKF